MRKKLQIAGFCILSIYALVMVFVMPSTAGSVCCTGTTVNIDDSTDYRFVNKMDILKYMNSANINPNGLSYKNINLHNMEKKIAEIPFVNGAQCYKSPGGLLCVDINQRKPILRIKTPTQDLYLDSEGGLMNISTAFSAYVPVLLSEKTLSKKYLKTDIYEFANYVYNDNFLNPLVEQIYIDINGKVEMVPRIGSQIVVLGSTDGYQKKMARLKKLYESGFSKVGWNKYKKIDLTYDNQAVCTRN